MCRGHSRCSSSLSPSYATRKPFSTSRLLLPAHAPTHRHPICSRTRNHTDTTPNGCGPPRSNPRLPPRPHALLAPPLPTPGPYTDTHADAAPCVGSPTRPYAGSTRPPRQSPPSPIGGGAWPRRRSPVEASACRAP